MQIHFLVDVFSAIGAALDLKVPNILCQKGHVYCPLIRIILFHFVSIASIPPVVDDGTCTFEVEQRESLRL